MIVASFIDSILNPIETILGKIIAYLYSVIPNLGIGIILVTMMLMLLLYPLTHKQQKSMLAMQTLGPKMKEIKEKYKDDRQKQTEETMKLYKEHGANQFGSCLPMLIQTPFFISIFRVVKDIQNYIPTDSKLFKSICEPVTTLKACQVNNIGFYQKLGYSPSKAETLSNTLPRGKEFLGMNLSKNLSSALGDANKNYQGILAYVVLLILIVAATYFNISRQQSRNPVQNNKMGFIKYVFPVAGLFSIFLPGGSNLYILTSAVWRAGQQEIIFHKVITPHREKMSLKEKEESLKLPEIKGIPTADEIKAQANESAQARAARKKRKKK